LIYDPSEPNTNAIWKVIWDHHVENASLLDNRDWTRGWIALKGANVPFPASGWSAEIKLFAGSIYNPNNNFSPGNCTYSLLSQISDCLVITEPGALSAVDGFYLAFHCQYGFNLPDVRIPLTKFVHQGSSLIWEYKGNFLNGTDAALVVNYYSQVIPELSLSIGFDAPDLFSVNGSTFLLVSPFDSNSTYRGCLLFQVYAIDNATLYRYPDGTPKIVLYVPGIPNSFRGACTFSSQSNGSGIVLSQLDLTKAAPFTIVNTMIEVPTNGSFLYVPPTTTTLSTSTTQNSASSNPTTTASSSNSTSQTSNSTNTNIQTTISTNFQTTISPNTSKKKIK